MSDDHTPDVPTAEDRQRVTIGLAGATFIGLAAVLGTVDAIGTGRFAFPVVPPHIDPDWRGFGRVIILVAAAGIAAFSVTRPENPDSGVTRSLALATGVVGLVAGLADLVDAHILHDVVSVRALIMTVGGLLLSYIGLRKGLWPESEAGARVADAGGRKPPGSRR